MRLGRKIGYFRHRLTVQTLIEEPNPGVSIVRTYRDDRIVWGYLEPIRGSVYYNGEQIDKSITHKCLIRFYQNLTSENWIYFDYRRFRIRFVYDVFERERFTHLLLEEDQDAVLKTSYLLLHSGGC